MASLTRGWPAAAAPVPPSGDSSPYVPAASALPEASAPAESALTLQVQMLWEARGAAKGRASGVRLSEAEVQVMAAQRSGWTAFVVGELDTPLSRRRRAGIEEAYFELGPAERALRLGRFRLPFGIYERGEVEYSGLIEPALVRGVGRLGEHLTRVGTGVLWARSLAPWRFQAALVNGDPPGGFSVSTASGAGVIRVERMAGPLLLGLDGYSGRVRQGEAGARTSVVGLDWRYAARWLQFRGEAILGGGSASGEHGVHGDLWYHPPGAPEVTALLRLESARLARRSYARATLGARYRFHRRPDATVALNLTQELGHPLGPPTRAEIQLLLLHRL